MQGDKLFISVDSVKEALSADAPWVDELFQRAMGSPVSEYPILIYVNKFIAEARF
jgi:hypothetical protein